MDNRDEIRQFLASRRGKLKPEQVGLSTGGRRRVPGLRREEVAVLAGVSTDWYTRLEKGHIAGISDEVLGSVARALRLDDAESEHLFNLARAARSRGRAGQRRTPQPRIRPSILRMLDAMVTSPAFVRNDRLDVLASNQMARALYSPVFDGSDPQLNLARFAFRDPAALDFYPDYDELAESTVAVLRGAAGRNPHDRALSDLVGELTTHSNTFAAIWAGHDVRHHDFGTKYFHHPLVGLIEVSFDSMELPEGGPTLTTYSAEPGSPSAEALALLASWSSPHPATQPTGLSS